MKLQLTKFFHSMSNLYTFPILSFFSTIIEVNGFHFIPRLTTLCCQIPYNAFYHTSLFNHPASLVPSFDSGTKIYYIVQHFLISKHLFPVGVRTRKKEKKNKKREDITSLKCNPQLRASHIPFLLILCIFISVLFLRKEILSLYS